MAMIDTLLMYEEELSPELSAEKADAVAAELRADNGFDHVYPRSVVGAKELVFFLYRHGGVKRLGIVGDGLPAPDPVEDARRSGEPLDLAVTRGKDRQGRNVHHLPLDAASARLVRGPFEFLRARTLGLQKSVGCGDRLGLATPGHVRAVRKGVRADGTCEMAGIFAQQSIRENTRTGRNPQIVMDDAMWGVFEEGWRLGFGADADHLKTTDDIDVCAAAGYTFYTIDPSAYVDGSADSATTAQLEEKVVKLPWSRLESTPADLKKLAHHPVDIGVQKVLLSEVDVLRAAVKYGAAVAHTVALNHHLTHVMGGRPFELEMSVDETDSVTSLAEHIYIATELNRLNVKWVSLAPRYAGSFEKGVDYIGNLDEFAQSFAGHVAVSRTFGPYKLSLHSGSDKFSIYPIASRLAGDLVHLKTAGTSYLEALRAIANVDPTLFREILTFAKERYPTDRATYHVSAEVEKVPEPDRLEDARLPHILEDYHGREVLHVTFGAVLNNPAFRDRFFAALTTHEELYTELIERHFDKHISPFLHK